jgi:cell division protein FtsL
VTPPAAAATVRRARVAAPPRPRVSPPRPRRISGPVRAPARQPTRQSTPAAAPLERGLVLGLLDALGSVASHGAVDRLIRGRIWIGVIAFALIGIVTLQLLVLQLNAGIGRTLVREAQLQRGNAALSIEDSELAGGERVESKAARLGMQLVPVGSLRFLTSYPPADIARAAAALNTPVHAASASTASNAGTAAGASSSETSAAVSAPTSAETAAANAEQTQSAAQTPGAEAPPAGEAGAASSTQAATTPTGEAGAPTHEATAPASAPASAAGGTESTGAG